MRQVSLLVLGLAVVVVPKLASAAVVVAEPTGDAEPAFLAELKGSLMTVAAEAPPDVNGALQSNARKNQAGWEFTVELTVELVLPDWSKPYSESRVVSMEKALSEAQGMARAAIRAHAAPKPDVAEKPEPLPKYYDRERARRMSVVPTLVLSLAGDAIFSLSFVGFIYGGWGAGFQASIAANVVGVALMGYGLIIGPSIGYFWIGQTRHAVGMSVLRQLTFAASMGTGIGYAIGVMNSDSDPCFDEGGGESRCIHPALLATSIVAFAATMVLAYVDAGLVGRAADRVNGGRREKSRPTVAVAPMAWSSGNGGSTFGLAVSGTF